MRLSEWTWRRLTRASVIRVPEVGGVYMLADPPGSRPTVFYVGKSGTLRGQLEQHLFERADPCIRRRTRVGTSLFCFRSVDGGEDERLAEETRLIAEYAPECNLRGETRLIEQDPTHAQEPMRSGHDG